MMRKILIAFCLLAVTTGTFAQTCEEREDKLLSAMGSLSAGYLYNTYGFIGSIADGYGHDAYNASTATDLVGSQKKLADNMIEVLEGLINDKALKSQSDKDYLSDAIDVVKGFKTQIDLFLKVVKNNNQSNLDAYENQRNKNWKAISELMGIDE